MSELPRQFVVADPKGVFLTLSDREARALLEDLRDDDDLSPNLFALRTQLEEWISDDL